MAKLSTIEDGQFVTKGLDERLCHEIPVSFLFGTVFVWVAHLKSLLAWD